MEDQVQPIKRQKSSMWTYFKKSENGTRVTCELCMREFQYCNNTSNMRDHLNRKHTEVLLNLSVSQNKNNEEENLYHSNQNRQQNITKYNENSSRKKLLDNLFVKMIALDMEPLRLAEREGLKAFIAALDSRYEMPKRSNATTILTKIYMKMKVQLMELLRKTCNLAITADTWTSNSNQGILGLTCHFIKDNKLISALLAAKVVEGHHNADNLSSVITSILEEWNCRDKVVVIVTDNAAVMIKVAENLRLRHIPCFAHSLNLIIKDTLQNCLELRALAEKCKAIVSHYRHSTLASDKLKLIQRDLKKKELKLIQHVDTRWNSSLHMISRIKEVRDELTLALNQNPNAPSNLTADEYSYIDEMEKMFEPIESATEAISGDEYVTLSLIIPLIKGMLLRYGEIEREPMSDFAKAVLENIKTSVTSKLKPYEKRSPCIISTLLNPHFKKLGFRTDSEVDRAVQFVQNEYSSYLSSLNKASPSPCENENDELESSAEGFIVPTKRSKKSNLFSYLQTQPQSSNRSHTADAIVDLRQYIEKPILPRTEYPIEYWSYSQNNLKHIALKYMCVPGSSTPSERVFSKAGQIVNDRRNRLSGDHINEILFINQNSKIFAK